MEDIICKADIKIKQKSKKVLIIKIIINVVIIGLIIICNFPTKVSGYVSISASKQKSYWTGTYYDAYSCVSCEYNENIFGFCVYRVTCSINATNDEEWWKSVSGEHYDYELDYDKAKEVLDYAKKVGYEYTDSTEYYSIIDSIKKYRDYPHHDGKKVNNLLLLAYIVVMFIIPLVWRKYIQFTVKRCSLQLDKDGVNGNRKKLFSNKSLNLPIEKVDSISIENNIIDKLVGGETIAIRSASGLIKFICVYNASEFVDKTLAAIKEYKESAKPVSENIQQNNGNDNFEQIQKLKSMLDSGIITQEEFDAKKKELLGL